MKISLVEGQRRLAFLWGDGSFLALLVLVVGVGVSPTSKDHVPEILTSD
jgi:hypothetical protein